jgi:hypothetical protein
MRWMDGCFIHGPTQARPTLSRPFSGSNFFNRPAWRVTESHKAGETSRNLKLCTGATARNGTRRANYTLNCDMRTAVQQTILHGLWQPVQFAGATTYACSLSTLSDNSK